MQIETLNPTAPLQAIVDRFAQAAPRQRAEMVLRAIGARSHKSGWLLANGRLIRYDVAPYWATDLNALAMAEREVRIAWRRYALFCSDEHGWTAVVGDPGEPILRIRAASERDVRSLAIILYGHIRQPRATPGIPGAHAPTADVKMPAVKAQA
jgi:hypothetical protein